jgi:hypothetical protein
LHSFELLLALLSDPKRHDLGIKILGLIHAYDASGKLELPFFFNDLMTATHGIDDPLFVPLVDLLEKPNGEALFQNFLVRLYLETDESTRDVIANLLYIAVMDKLNDTRIALIKEALKMVTTRSEEMRRIYALLSDPREKQEIDKAESVDEYKRGLEARKKSGDGEGGASGSKPPVSPAPAAPSTPQAAGNPMSSKPVVIEGFEVIDDRRPVHQSLAMRARASSRPSMGVQAARMSRVVFFARPVMPFNAARNMQSGAGVFGAGGR